MKNKIALDSLTVGYNGYPLISDITLSLVPGEILSLIGPNGAGKSTILKTITRHLASIGGTIYIDGSDMHSMNGRDIATRMAVVLTDRVRPELMTCYELVATGRYPYTGNFGRLTPEDKAIVTKSLETVHALEIADRDVSEISDGQRQRIMLARAICQDPEIIVLDEPTSFLDIKHKIELLEILRSMAKERGITVVMSLHDIDLAEKISDKIVCVKGDHIAAYGTPDEIITDETISKLYEIERGSFNALFGSVELDAPKGEPRFFVIGGAGYGVQFYRALQKRGVPFAAGILFENDIDTAIARALTDHLVCAQAFAPIAEELPARAKELIDSVEYVIDSGCPVGEFNQANAELLEHARANGKHVLSSLEELAEVTL
ncbi:MAG: ABC transporter ATP-binding protein [Lachnospiraceae bacterium]|nr:ABC transporter ATP-binding protein [Lachnospiraceae bacterium]